jgi:hypothetical protein
MEWVGEFFRTLPMVFSALWEFMRGWAGVAIIVGSGGMIIGFALLSTLLRDKFGWLAAIFGVMSATVAAWWAFGIIPSAWIYFADGQRDLMENTVIPGTFGVGRFQLASNFYQVVRDLVVITETQLAMVAFAVIALQIQKRFPKALAEGEEPRPQSGGYK